MSSLRLLAAIGILASLSGCATDPDDPSVRVQLDEQVVVAPPGGPAMVAFAIHNVGRAPAFFRGCRRPIPVTVDRASGTTWTETLAFDTFCPAVIVPAALELRPGETFRTSVDVVAAGRYRFRLSFGTSAADPHGFEAATAAFEVR